MIRALGPLHEREVIPIPEGTDLPVVLSPCPVCDSDTARPEFSIEDMEERVVVCTGCGLGRLHPLPDDVTLASFYPDAYYGRPGRKFQGVTESLVRLVGARHLRFLTAGLKRGARVLDLGCGRGVLLESVADAGFEAHGVEMSAAAASGADSRAQIRIAPHLVDAGYPSDHFDAVIIWHALEHFSDPRGTIEEVRRILRPGGRLVVAVPNFGSFQARWSGSFWFHLDLPRHLYHFPLSALGTLLERCGFQILAEHHFSLRQNPFGWLQSYLNRFSNLPRNGLYLLLHMRDPDEPVPYTPGIRLLLRLAYLVGMPVALVLSVLEVLVASGATIHVVAERQEGPVLTRAEEAPR